MNKTIYILLFLFTITGVLATGGYNRTVYTTSPSTNYTVPTGVYWLLVEAWGAGGGGGSVIVDDNAGSGGGGGGAYVVSTIKVTPGDSFNFSVATSTAGGTGGYGGGNGSDSWFNSTSTLNADGGNGSAGYYGTPQYGGGSGGTAAGSIGMLIRYGRNGGTGWGAAGWGSAGGGGGGGEYGLGIAGSDAQSGAGGDGGAGGNKNGGKGGDGAFVDSVGQAGSTYGGGGAGGYCDASCGSKAGGAGGAGAVIISESYWNFTPINIYFRDESNENTINNVSLEILGDDNIFELEVNTTIGNLSSVFLPTGNYSFRFWSDGYTQRYYYMNHSNTTNNDIWLYLLNNTESTSITMQVYDIDANIVPNAHVKAMTKNGTTYYNSGNCETNYLGQCSIYLNLYDTTYYFMIEVNGATRLVSGDTTITASTMTFVITSEESLYEVFFENNEFTFNLTDDGEDNFSYAWNDINSNVVNACLYVYTQKGAYQTYKNSSCLTTSSGGILLTQNYTGTFDKIIAKAYLEDSSGVNQLVDTYEIIINPYKAVMGTTGLFYFGFLLFGTVVFALLYDIAIAIAGGFVLLFILDSIGLISMGWVGLSALLVAGIAIIMVVKQK